MAFEVGKKPGGIRTGHLRSSRWFVCRRPKVRCFATREEAEAFVNSGGSGGVSPVSVDDRKRAARAGTGDAAAPSKTAGVWQGGFIGAGGQNTDAEKAEECREHLNQEEAELKMALLCAPAMLEEAAPQEMHPDEEDAVLRSLNRHLRGEDGETSDEGSSDSNNTLVNDERGQPKPLAIAKRAPFYGYTPMAVPSATENPPQSLVLGVWFGGQRLQVPGIPLTHPHPTPTHPVIPSTY